MNYKAPELTALTPAIDAIQAIKPQKDTTDSGFPETAATAYEDWE